MIYNFQQSSWINSVDYDFNHLHPGSQSIAVPGNKIFNLGGFNRRNLNMSDVFEFNIEEKKTYKRANMITGRVLFG